MSRYTLLFLLNLPFIILAVLSAITQYKLGRQSRFKLWLQLLFWLCIATGLIMAEPIYVWLFSNNLTQTEPLSLFDVIQITAIVVVFYVASRAYSKVELLENRLQSLNRELSIRLSDKTNKHS